MRQRGPQSDTLHRTHPAHGHIPAEGGSRSFPAEPWEDCSSSWHLDLERPWGRGPAAKPRPGSWQTETWDNKYCCQYRCPKPLSFGVISYAAINNSLGKQSTTLFCFGECRRADSEMRGKRLRKAKEAGKQEYLHPAFEATFPGMRFSSFTFILMGKLILNWATFEFCVIPSLWSDSTLFIFIVFLRLQNLFVPFNLKWHFWWNFRIPKSLVLELLVITIRLFPQLKIPVNFVGTVLRKANYHQTQILAAEKGRWFWVKSTSFVFYFHIPFQPHVPFISEDDPLSRLRR